MPPLERNEEGGINGSVCCLFLSCASQKFACSVMFLQHVGKGVLHGLEISTIKKKVKREKSSLGSSQLYNYSPSTGRD